VSNNGLTEAQKLLLQKFPDLPEDDPLVELAAWNAALEKKVDDFGGRLDVWTNAILKQTDLATQQNQLIVSQNLTLQETAKNNAALGQALMKLKQGLSELQTEFNSLENTILGQGNNLMSLSDKSLSLSRKLDDLSLKLKSLEALETLNSRVDSLTTNIKTLTTSINSLTQGFNFDCWVTYSALCLLGLLMLGQFLALGQWGRSLESQIEQVNGNVNNALIRLKRLENR
jgi:hypothetical protein